VGVVYAQAMLRRSKWGENVSEQMNSELRDGVYSSTADNLALASVLHAVS